MQPIYVDPWLFLGLVLAGVYGLERVLVDVVRFIERRWPSKPKPPAPPTIVRP